MCRMCATRVPLFVLLTLVSVLSVVWAGDTTIAAAPGASPVFPAPPESADSGNIVGPGGGQVATPDGRITVDLPAGAVTRSTLMLPGITSPGGRPSDTIFDIDITAADANDGTAVTFEKPVTVHIAAMPGDLAHLPSGASTPYVAKLDTSAGTWATVEDSDTAAGAATFEITQPGHFTFKVQPPARDDKVSALIPGSLGGALISRDKGVSLEFAGVAVKETLRVEYQPVERFAADFEIVRQFELDAYAVDRADARVTAFEQPVAITVAHTSDELAGLSYEDLILYWRDESKNQWVPVDGQVSNGDGTLTIRATKTAQDMGLTPVAHFEGGFGAWKKAGGPVETVEPKK